MEEHAQYMQRCLELARMAAQDGESPVGSLIVKGGQIIGEAYEKSRQLGDITRHAEMLAILAALKNTADLSGSILYSNVEPCILCAYAIRHYKIAEVVYRRSAGELGSTNPPYNILTLPLRSWAAPPKVTMY
jgi:tRNA(Arg) A34 adenosine deaminase TadA